MLLRTTPMRWNWGDVHASNYKGTEEVLFFRNKLLSFFDVGWPSCSQTEVSRSCPSRTQEFCPKTKIDNK